MNRILLIFFVILFSCDNYFVPKNSNPIARLNQDYLFEDEISVIIDDQQEKLDSIIKVNEFINQWAINKILRSGARLNLSENRLLEINSMVYDYETELLSNSYLEALVNSTISLEVDSLKLDSLYKKNYEIFKLNEDLIQYAFIYLPNTNPDISQIRGKLRRYNQDDRVLLDSISYQFIKHSFADSVWHRRNDLYKTISIMNNYRYKSLKKYKFFQFKDSLGLYLIKITSLLNKGEYAPIEFVSPTLEYMILNKRKVNLVDEIKKEILENAIETNKLEIYKDE
ncbi:MAG: hypothetical protein CMC37_04315 [Flavobacteriaceae bacterium]|nr:hypothetical protein [Flavobacteriaceae bacterium]|tara:strand:- start:1923 stop:2771 length:849 start_codon:yes stop_codon:yes gene_type:complete